MISVIIPLYNKEKYILSTIESLFAQTNKDWECVVVDDGSTDRSAEIVQSVCDKRIHYIKKDNGGVSSARNYGVEHTKGEYILYLDADDIILPDCIEHFQKAINTFGDYDIYTGNFYIEREGIKKLFIKKAIEGEARNGMKLLFKHEMYMRPGAYIIKKEKAKDNPFDEALSRYEDMEIQLRYIKSCKICVFKDALMVYQYDENGLSLKVDRFHKDYLSQLCVKKCSGFWEKQYVFNCMYIAIRNYSSYLVKDYYKYLPQIILAKVLSVIMR